MHSMRSKIAISCLCVGISSAAPVLAQSTTAAADAEFAAGRYAIALAEYQRLAAQGSPGAAERAGEMLYYGPTRYGHVIARDVQRAKDLLTQAARAGRPVASILLERIDAPAVLPDPTSDPSVFGPYGC